MDINNFVKKFAEQIEDADISTITASTNYKAIPEWSSIVSLMIIGMIEEEYGVEIGSSDLNNTTTIQDLFEVVKTKK